MRVEIRTLRVLTLLVLAFVALTVKAQKEEMFNPVNTSVTSQTIAPDARAAGMGDVGAATDPDVVSQYWNPAKYPFTISRAGVALNYTPWLRQLVNDMDLAYLVGSYRIGDYSAVSGSLRYFSLGEVYTSSSLDATNDMTINPYEMSLDVAYSLMLNEQFSLSAGVRWIYSDLTYDFTEDTSPGSAFAADISCYYQNYLNIGARECQLGLGLNISNIGSKITFGGDEHSEFIPTNMRLGASLMIPVDEYNRFTIAAEDNKVHGLLHVGGDRLTVEGFVVGGGCAHLAQHVLRPEVGHSESIDLELVVDALVEVECLHEPQGDLAV